MLSIKKRYLGVPGLAVLAGLVLMLSACGGGGGGGGASSGTSGSTATTATGAADTAAAKLDILSIQITNQLLNQAAALTAGQTSHPWPTSVVRGSDGIDAHLDRLNEIRNIMKLPVLNWNDQLASAAQCHADYLTLNRQFGHAEATTGQGYCGAGFAERQAKAGYAAYINAELIINGDPKSRSDGVAYMDAILSSPGHRIVALAHEFSEIGIAAAPLTTELGAKFNVTYPDYRVLVYPYSGQTGVATGYAPASETPNPLPGVALAGFPITLHAGLFVKFTVVSAKLVNTRTGAQRALTSPTAIGTSQNAYFFFPNDPLESGATYLFTADVLANGLPEKISSVFSTVNF